MQENQSEQLPVSMRASERIPADVRDCMQCLIIMYGEAHIDTLAQLLNLTAYAETEYSHICALRRS